MPKYHVIIPAAGSGSRFGGSTKKQFLQIKGRRLFEWTLDVFLKANLFSKIVVCLPASEKLPSSHKINFIEGGQTRAESVYKGFMALCAQDEDKILIHDAVRPCVSIDLILRVVQALEKKQAVIPVLPLSDTVKEISENRVIKTVDRKHLFTVQTPQGFSYELLKKTYEHISVLSDGYTDEAALVEAIGEEVMTVDGEKTNIKVTTPDDLRLAAWILKNIGHEKF